MNKITIPPRKKTSLIARLLSGLNKNPALEQEKSRLEAFLDAFPGEYCGWAKDGTLVYSKGFCQAFDLEIIHSITDLQTSLSPSDAAALEGMFERLQTHATPFTLSANNNTDTKSLKLSGSQGKNIDGQEHFNVLWVEDVTAQVQAHDAFVHDTQVQIETLNKFKTLLDFVPRPLWLRDHEQKIVWCNATYADFLNKSKDEILENQSEIYGQLRKQKNDNEDTVLPGPTMAKAALKAGQDIETRCHNTVKGGRMLMNITEIPMPDMGQTLGIAYNVTREEELESKLKRYQSSTKELLEQLRSAIAIYDIDQKLEFYNSAFAQLWDLEDKYLNKRPKLGDTMEKLRETRRLPEQADFKRFKQTWLNMFTGLIDPYEDMMHLPDGTTLRVLIVPHSLGGLMMTFEDVSSRLELESSYNTLIAVQKETLDNLAEGVAVYGSDGRLKLSNPAFGRMWGLNPEDLDGEPHISNVVSKMKAFFKKDEWQDRQEELIAKGLDRIMHEGRLIRADKNLIDFTTVPLPDGGVLITYTDVTDTVRVENALREKFTALEAAEKLKLDFLANVSYQLRTPLNAIMGFNEILDQEYFGTLNDRQKEYTRDMKEAGERLLELINDILDLSTLEAGYMTLQRSDVNVYELLNTLTDLTIEWARKDNITIKVECKENIGNVRADERRLQQIIINLIRNAITFTPEKGEITLIATREKDMMSIAVKDTGIGIQEEDRMRIFEPFERAQNDSLHVKAGNKNGAGLGLSLVRNITDLHGGNVVLESEINKGTTVSIQLPLMEIDTTLKIKPDESSKDQMYS